VRTWRNKNERVSYHRIDLEIFQVETYPPFDLFIKTENVVTAVFRAGAPFDSHQQQCLKAAETDGVYIAAKSLPQYQEYAEQNLQFLMASENIPLRRRAEIVYHVVTGLVEEVFADVPEVPLIERAARVAELIVAFLQKSPGAVCEFLAVAAHDYSAVAHSANVGILSVAMGQQIGIQDRRSLEDLGIGALLHDIGQTRISRRILQKRGALTTAEYDLIKKAPWWGVEILAQSGTIRQDAFIPVMQHQERMDGTGYPVGLRGDDIHVYGRICGVVEAYDAITSRHVYREALDSYPALRTMMGDSKKFDPVLLEAFIRLLGRQPEPCDATASVQPA
jgi:HD-GYP domain-containing protein (c-di-GMP phosphodiesterase class II)